MADPVSRSRTFASGVAVSLIPRSKAGVWALTHGAQLVSMLPGGLTKAVAKLNTKGVRLYDSMRFKEYAPPRPG